MRQIFLDTETTGLNPESGDRIVEIGCVEMVKRRLSGNNLHLYLNPQRNSHEAALKVHGLTTEFLSDKPLFPQVVQQLIAYLKDAEIIIHNANFDVGFLNSELRRAGQAELADHVAKITDSLVLAREMFPGKANSLDALCKRLEVDNSNRSLHGALLDAGLLAQVYIGMTRGQNSLVMDHFAGAPGHSQNKTELAVDLRAFVLPVPHASQQEQEHHAAVLDELDKASANQTQWRLLGP
jgi:DNA polymerase III subunit epsilon